MASQAALELLIELQDRASKGLGSIGGSLRNISETALGMFAGGLITKGFDALTSTLGDAFAGAQEARVIMAQTEQVIKTMGNAAGVTAEHVADFAASLSDAAGKSLFGDDQIQSATNLLLTFGEIKGETLDLATTLSVDLAQALGGAPADKAMMLGKALNDPIKGITALGKAGLTFSEEQKAVIAALVETGDIAGAQKIILDELNKQVGGQAEAAAKAAGGMVQFKARLGEAAETLATGLLPVIDKLGIFLNDTIAPAVEQLAAVAIPALTAAWVTLQPAIQFILDNIEPIAAGLLAVGAGILVSLVPAFIAWATAAGTAAIATITALAPVLIPIAAIGAAVALLTAAWMNDWGGIRTTIETFWNSTGKPIFEQLQTWLAGTLTTAIQTLSQFWTGTLQPALTAVWSFIQQNIIPILNTLVTVYIAVLKKEIEVLSALWNNVLLPALKVIWEFIQDNVIPIISALVNVGIAILKKEIEALSALWNNVLLPALTAVWNFIQTNVIPVIEATATRASSLAGTIRDTLGPAFAWLGDNVLKPVAGFFGDISGAVQDVIDWLNDLANKINSIQIPDWLQGHSPPPMADWFSAIADAARRAGDAAGDFAMPGIPVPAPSARAPQSMQEALASIPSQSAAAVAFHPGAIVINAPAGTNERQIAEIVIREIDRRIRSKK